MTTPQQIDFNQIMYYIMGIVMLSVVGYVVFKELGPSKAPQPQLLAATRAEIAEEELEEKRLRLESWGKVIADQAGVKFIRLEEGWQPKYTTVQYWFIDDQGNEILARDLDDLRWKLEATKRQW